MTPIQSPHPEPEPAVDMSPHAIMARLEMLGQLNDLCRFLASGTLLPRESDIKQFGVSGSPATIVQLAAGVAFQPETHPSSDTIMAEYVE